jgi:hypothetical protein
MKSLLVKSGVILIGLAIFCYVEVWGADWKYYGESVEGKYFYDAESVTRPSKDIVRVRQKLIYSEKGVNEMVNIMKKNEYKNLSEMLSLYEFNCGNKRSHLLSVSFSSKDGKVLMSDNNPPPNWHFINPAFIHENELYKILCK